MRPILSASGTYNYPLAKWLEEKLKPLSTNKYCINDIFGFTDETQNTDIESDHILVSYDVSALFTNVPLMKTINIVVDKAFEDDWFNETHSMQLQKHQLTELLKIATSNQLFQFNGEWCSHGLATWPTTGQCLHVLYREPTGTKEHDPVLLSKICR